MTWEHVIQDGVQNGTIRIFYHSQMETAGARRAVCLGTSTDGWRIFRQTGPRFSLSFLAKMQQTGRARFNRFDRLVFCQTAVRNCARFSQDFSRISGGMKNQAKSSVPSVSELHDICPTAQDTLIYQTIFQPGSDGERLFKAR